MRTRAEMVFLAVLLLAGGGRAQVAVSDPLDVPLKAWDTHAVTAPAGAPATFIDFTADPSADGGDLFDVASSQPAAQVSLVLPDGSEVTAATAGALGFDWVLLDEGSFAGTQLPSALATPGTHTLIILPPGAAAGHYAVKVDATLAPADALVVASYFPSSPVRVGAATSAPLYRVGDTVFLFGLAFDGSLPIAGAGVEARIIDLADRAAAPVSIALSDSGPFDVAPGDGLYTGSFDALRPGKYSASIEASGVSALGVPFSRTATVEFQVVPALASFTSFQDAGIDDNGNGLFDRLRVTAAVDVQTPGRYELGVSLVAAGGARIQSSAKATLAARAQAISVSFPAADVLGLGSDGPFAIRDATLVFLDDPGVPLADLRADAGLTQAYARSSFDRGPIFATGVNTVQGIDTNGNGRFDLLRIDAGFSVARAGFYQWSGRLVDGSGRELDFASGQAFLAAGTSPIRFQFDGRKIGAACVSGPLALRSVLFFGPAGSLVIEELLQTQPFSASDFEGTTCNRPPVAVAGPDQALECAGPAGAPATLDGSGSSDPDGDPLSFQWTDEAGTVVGTTAAVTLNVPLGTHSFTLTVQDGKGGTSSDSVEIAVRDTLPPAISLALTPAQLLVPNHKLEPVSAAVEVSDRCDAKPRVELRSIVSNEPDDGLGDGDTKGDIQDAAFGTDDRDFLLRAERAGTGTGRVYTVTYGATDASGNAATVSATVEVPHDR